MTTHSDPLFEPLVIPSTVTATNAPTNTRLEALMIGIPADLRRQIREERREEIARWREQLMWARDRLQHFGKTTKEIDYFLAKEES